MDKTMTRFLAILAALTCAASAQTFRTVTADTNNVIRTNFTLGAAQVSGAFAISNVTGLQSALDGKLATNGDALALTNFPALLLRTNGSASGLTNFPASILQTNSSLSAFPAGLLRTNGDGSGLTNLPNADLGSATGVLPLANGGTGGTNASEARTALELGTAATNDATAFQPADTNLTALASGDGSSLTNVTITDASTLTNFPAELLRTNGDAAGLTNFPASVLLTNGDAAGLTNFPAELLRTNGDGSGLSNVSVDLTTVLPSYSGNDGKVLAVATGGTNVEWTAISNTVTDGSLITNFPSYLLQTNGDASGLTNFPIFNQNTTGTASNVTGVVAITNGGSGQTTAAAAIEAFLPAYSGNANRILALNSNASGLLWVTNTAGASISDSSATRMGPFQYDLEATSTNGALGGVGNDIMNGWLVQATATNGSYHVNRTWLPIFGLSATRASTNSIYDIPIKFSEPFKFGMHIGTTSTNTMLGNSRVYVGTTDSYTNGNATGVVIGWRLQTNTIFAAMHNGTNYSEPFSKTNALAGTNWSWVWCWVEGDGNGNVTWYVNGEELGTATNGPTTDSSGAMMSIVSHNDTGTNLGATTILRVQNFKADFGD